MTVHTLSSLECPVAAAVAAEVMIAGGLTTEVAAAVAAAKSGELLNLIAVHVQERVILLIL
jgi:hypothetical protein